MQRAVILLRDAGLDRLNAELYRGEKLIDAIVQFARDPAAFRFLGLEDQPRQFAQLRLDRGFLTLGRLLAQRIHDG